MDNESFDVYVEKRIEMIRKVLKSKGAEYSTDGDRLSNFKRTAQMKNETPEKALQGMWAKQLTSVFDIVDRVEKENRKMGLWFRLNPRNWLTKKLLEEKIGDAINYLIILEVMLKERCEYD